MSHARIIVRLFQQINKFCHLTGHEQRIFLAASVWLPIAWAALRLFGLVATQRSVVGPNSQRTLIVSGKEIERTGKMVAAAGRHSFAPATCLTRSIVLVRLLRRQGAQVQLRIGVRLTNGALDAHAWVEHQGVPVNERKNISEDFPAFTDVLAPDALPRL